jgi:hypothetical protein
MHSPPAKRMSLKYMFRAISARIISSYSEWVGYKKSIFSTELKELADLVDSLKKLVIAP